LNQRDFLFPIFMFARYLFVAALRLTFRDHQMHVFLWRQPGNKLREMVARALFAYHRENSVAVNVLDFASNRHSPDANRRAFNLIATWHSALFS
jgi:hypothetical protein